jgi:peptidoglycan/xylan/chitin deacetylase (PgdA/CDA1 family)
MSFVALSVDDAPSIAGGSGAVVADPGRMDRIREVLLAAGVSHCVAFVIGILAAGQEPRLERWLASGYELGNHTFDHLAASRTSLREYVASVSRCDALLAGLGAFAGGRQRWFRHPFLDRGADASGRAALGAALADLGYEQVPGSVDLFDHCYEEPLARALRDGDAGRLAQADARYRAAALASLAATERQVWRATRREAPQLAYFHFGLASERNLAHVLAALGERGTRWCSLEEALADPLYVAYVGDPARSGLVTGDLPRGLGARLGGRLADLSQRLGLFQQSQLGPRWPHLG